MLFPICHTLPHFGIHFLVIIVQNNLHSLNLFGLTSQRYELFLKLQNFPAKNTFGRASVRGRRRMRKRTRKNGSRDWTSVSKTFNPRAKKASPLHFRRGRLYSSKCTIGPLCTTGEGHMWFMPNHHKPPLFLIK